MEREKRGGGLGAEKKRGRSNLQMKDGMKGDKEEYGDAWPIGHRGSLNRFLQAKGVGWQAEWGLGWREEEDS